MQMKLLSTGRLSPAPGRVSSLGLVHSCARVKVGIFNTDQERLAINWIPPGCGSAWAAAEARWALSSRGTANESRRDLLAAVRPLSTGAPVVPLIAFPRGQIGVE